MMMMMISRKEKKLTLPNNAREAQAGFLLRGIELLPEPLVQLLRDRFAGHGGANLCELSLVEALGVRKAPEIVVAQIHAHDLSVCVPLNEGRPHCAGASLRT